MSSGGVVARQVVKCHMSNCDRVRQRDHECPLDPVKSPALPWEQQREALGGKKGDTAVNVWKSKNYVSRGEKEKGGKEREDRKLRCIITSGK